MRELINLLEEALAEGTLDTTHDVDMAQDVADHTAGDGAKLQGAYLDPATISEYFPSIVDQHAFNRAWRKLVANKEENLTRNEAWELARAFIDLVRMDKPDKLSFLRRIMLVHLNPESEGEAIKTVYR
jgi:hypothetical protein